jgi:hypothetical protein
MLAERDPHTDLLVRSGQCPTHGLVQATKPVPRVRFPFLVFGVLRLWAMQRPYRCPACGGRVHGS